MPKRRDDFELTPEEHEYLAAFVADIKRLIALNLMGELTDEELDERLRSRWEPGAQKRRRKKRGGGKKEKENG